MREFERWAPPDMRVVPLYGDSLSRSIIKDNELFTSDGVLRAHVVVTTYENVTAEATALRKVTRWDCMVVDEGQRLKGGDDGKLFKAVQSIRCGFRVLLSGTSINNNIGELFWLLNALAPDKYNVAELKEKYGDDTLTDGAVKEIQDMLRPRFLRRIKEDVLSLPPLHTVVVPLTLRPFQKLVRRPCSGPS